MPWRSAFSLGLVLMSSKVFLLPKVVGQLIVRSQDAKLSSLWTSRRGSRRRRSGLQLGLWLNLMKPWLLEAGLQDIVARSYRDLESASPL